MEDAVASIRTLASTDLSNNAVIVLFQDHEGYLWFGTSMRDGILYRLKPGETGRYLPKVSFPRTVPEVPARIAFDRGGRVWISVGTNGLYCFDPAGTVWGGTLGGGGFRLGKTSGEKLLHYDPSTFTFTTHIGGQGTSITAIY